jgi:hypothetical protein
MFELIDAGFNGLLGTWGSSILFSISYWCVSPLYSIKETFGERSIGGETSGIF